MSGNIHNVICPYCRSNAELVTGKVIYPHLSSLANKKYYLCAHCKAYVGTHYRTGIPLGRLADKDLREAKIRAHTYFDRLWKDGALTRGSAYTWLAKALQMKEEDCHIGMFDIILCNRVVKLIKENII